jgi:hypothetical protein
MPWLASSDRPGPVDGSQSGRAVAAEEPGAITVPAKKLQELRRERADAAFPERFGPCPKLLSETGPAASLEEPGGPGGL